MQIRFFALLGCYTAYIARDLQTFRDNLSVPLSRVKQSKQKVRTQVISPEHLGMQLYGELWAAIGSQRT